MKKFSFSFLCKQNPMEMPANGQTRHCSKCARDIMDFTGMRPEEIARHLKTAVKPCGFMLPWQLDETNEYLQAQQTNGLVRFKRLARIAAVVSTPLVLNQAQAQQISHTNVEQNGRQNDPLAEVLIRSVSGTALVGMAIDITNETGDLIAQLHTDELGKIYLDRQWTQQGKLTLKNESLGISKTVDLKEGNACVIWNTRIEAQPVKQEKQTGPAYAFRFKLSNDNELKTLSSAKVDITLYDSLNNVIRELKGKTDRKGELELKDSELLNINYVMFTVHTKEGLKTTYATLKRMDLNKTNELVIEDYERMTMGIMVEY